MSTETFRVIGLPDTQKYSELYPDIFLAQTQWIVDNFTALNIEFVSHYGDVVQHGTGPLAMQEYINARAAMSILRDANVPHGIVAGNHDVLQSGSIGQTYDNTNYLNYFSPQEWFGDREWFGGASPSGMSTYQIFAGGGTQFLAFHLDLETPHSELAWAQGIINQHRDKPVMLTTHRYLQDAEDYTFGIPIIPSGRYPEIWYAIERQYNPNGIRSEAFFNHFIATNRNVFLVNAGHFHEEYRQTSFNIHGLPVYEVLADYQDDPNGGNGYLRIMEFDVPGDRINVSSYSPTLDNFLNKDESQFSLAVDFDQYIAPNTTVYFQNGVGGYAGTQDTWINEAAPSQSYGDSAVLVVDDDTSMRWLRDYQGQALLRFDDIIGDQAGQIPFGATITRANLKLTLQDDIDNPFHNPDFRLHYMTHDWDEATTWDALTAGLAAGDDFDSTPVAAFAGNNEPHGYNLRHLDVREAVQRWANGEANYGLGIVSQIIRGNNEGIELFASEASQIMFRPALEVEFVLT